MTKDTFEDALIELRDKEFEKKFTYEKESMIGNKPKTVWIMYKLYSIIIFILY